MKKINFCLMAVLLSIGISATAALAQPAVKPAAPSATFERTWVDHNITEGGKLGMKIHTAFTVFGMKDVASYLQIKFQTRDGKDLKDTNSEFEHEDGSVAAFGELTPGFNPTLYKDYDIFMPYDELDIATPGKYLLRMDVDVIYKAGGLIQHLTFYDFDYTKPAKTVAPVKPGAPGATFDRVWVEDNVTVGGKRGMKIHTAFTVFGLKSVSCYLQLKFLTSDGKPLMDKNGEFEHEDGSVAAFGEFKPEYDSALFKDFSIFMPYAEFDLPSGKYNLKVDVDVIYEAGELIQHLTIYEFVYTKP